MVLYCIALREIDFCLLISVIIKNVLRTLLEGTWSSVGFQLFIVKQSILADHLPIAREKFKYHKLYQGFNWEHPPG